MTARATPPFELWLFSTEDAMVCEAAAAGIDGLIVDWERRGKAERQADADTQIGADTVDDLRRVRSLTGAPILCRINGVGETTASEVEQAIDGGATELLIPMVRGVDDVRIVLEQVDRRCGVGILVETVAAIEWAPDLAALPLTRVYVGLNDLAIERGTTNIFSPLIDGTLERLRPQFRMPFGFGGLTLPECGHPIPCRLLMSALRRLDCQFSFLRRSFHRDVAGRTLSRELPRIREALRSAAADSRDHAELERAIVAWA